MKYSEQISRVTAWVKTASQNKWISLVIRLLILVLCAYYLVVNLLKIKSTQVSFQFNFVYAGVASVFILISIFLGAIGFYVTLRAFSFPVGGIEAMNIHLQSNLAKYIPGYAWQLIGKAYLTRKTGISLRLVGIAMAVELIQLLLAGVFLGVIFIPREMILRWNIAYVISYLPAIRLGAGLILILFPIGFTLAFRKIGQNLHASSVSPAWMLGSTLCMFIGWIFLGLSYWFLGKSLFQISIDHLPVFIFTMAASFLIGLAIIVIPASIGVRESVMVWMIGPVIGAPQAVIIAALSRVVMTLCEVISAYGIRFFKPGPINPKVVDNHGPSE